MADVRQEGLPRRETGQFVQGLLDRFWSLRDRILASEEFRRRAAAFPLTRPIARRRATAVFDLCAGFVYSQVLLACVQLRVFEILSEGPAELPLLARRLGLTLDACKRLVDAAVALRLLERRGGDRYGLGPLGAALVSNPGLTAMIEHHRHLYRDLSNPVALLRGEANETELARYWPYAGAKEPETLSGDTVADYSALMAASQSTLADEVLDAFPFRHHRVLMDVGGGDGAFLIRAAARFPHLRLMLFDLPAVAALAKANFAAHGLSAKSEVESGDFFKAQLPEGADVISLVRVVLDHPDEKVLILLRSIRRALGSEGVLLVAEQLSEPNSSPMGSAYFGFYLLAMGRGRARTAEEMERLIRAAGFSRVDVRKGRGALQTGIVIARR